MFLLLSPIMTNLTQLEALTLNNIESDYIVTITFLNNNHNRNDIFYKIFHLRALKYCQLETSNSF
jgi:hypothetical protein